MNLYAWLIEFGLAVQVAYRDMFHVTKLYSYESRGGRLVAKSAIAEVSPHASLFKLPSFAPVPDAPAAGRGQQIINHPDDNDRAEVREWVFYRGT
jgi:hypothetical protein